MENKTKKEYWIVAVDSDSFNHEPQKLRLWQVSIAKKEGFKIFPNKEECQKECDFQNSL